MAKKLLRKVEGKLLSGVCAGLGDYLQTDPNIVRGLFVLSNFLFGGIPIILYVVFTIILPKEQKQERIPFNPNIYNNAQSSNPTVSQTVSPNSANSIDINNASEQELAMLPGLTPIQIRQIIQVRQTRGGFRSIEEMAESLSLKPHIIERIRPLVKVYPIQNWSRSDQPGRRVDY